MPERRTLDKQTYYICGQCKDKQWHLRSEEPPVPCPDCGWNHKARRKDNLPSQIRLDLSQY